MKPKLKLSPTSPYSQAQLCSFILNSSMFIPMSNTEYQGIRTASLHLLLLPPHTLPLLQETTDLLGKAPLLPETAAGGAVTAWFSLLQFMSWL